MSDDTTKTTDDVVVDAGDGAKPDSDSTETRDEHVDDSKTDSKEDDSKLMSALKKERDARKQHEKELKELRKYKEEQDRQNMSEQEKLLADLEVARAESADNRKKLADALLRSEFQAQAAAHGMNPIVVDDVYASQLSSGNIGVNDDGVFGVQESIESLKSSKSLYFGGNDTIITPGKTNSGTSTQKTCDTRLSVDEATAVSWFKSAGVSADDYLKNKSI